MPSRTLKGTWVTTPRISLLLIGLVGCEARLLDAEWSGGTFLEITGPVDRSVAGGSGELRAAIAWAWIAGGEVGASVEDVPFEPRVYQYDVTIEHPPSPDAAAVTVEAPGVFAAKPSLGLLLGTALLYTSPDGSSLELADGPQPVLDALIAPGARADGLRIPDGGTILASWSDHRLGAAVGLGSASRFDEIVGWSDAPPLCGVDAMAAGLTLYRRASDDCERWVPVATAGERTEFQGVPLVPLEP